MIGKSTSYGFVIVTLALLFEASLVITGCGTATSESILERNKGLVRHMNDEVWNKGNLDILDELYSPDFVRHFLPDGSELSGIDSLREHVRRHREAFPDWREEIQRIVAERGKRFRLMRCRSCELKTVELPNSGSCRICSVCSSNSPGRKMNEEVVPAGLL
jgi:hypothetical protein